MPSHSTPSDATLAGIRRAAAQMATHAASRVETQHEWFRELGADERSWVGLIAQAGIAAFIDWLEDPEADSSGAVDVFAEAPRELTRSISLAQTLDLLRIFIDLIEEEAPTFAEPDEQAAVRDALLYYGREVAFGAAQIYARAAESRGAWDARLESLVVDTVVRGESDSSLGSRVNALGWADVRGVLVLVGASPDGDEASVIDPLRRAARHAGLELLVSVEGRRLIAVVGGISEESLDLLKPLTHHFGSGPLIAGPLVPHLYAAGRSARDALRGYAAAPAVPGLQRPAWSSDLLAARAIAGDDKARRDLAALARGALDVGTPLGDTVRTFIREGSFESTARALFVHANTVRYRLSRIADLTGLDATDTDDAFTLRLAIMLSDLDQGRPAGRWSIS